MTQTGTPKQRIAPKQFSYLTDLRARGDDAALDAYANEIGWPYRATQAQLTEWNLTAPSPVGQAQ